MPPQPVSPPEAPMKIPGGRGPRPPARAPSRPMTVTSPIEMASLERDPSAGPRPRILVVEDDEGMRSMLTELLREEGYEAEAEPDTISGFIRLVAAGADVLVLDWKMPDLDGFMLLASVRRCCPGLPVIFVTAFATSELRRKALDAGAFAFVGKPFRRAEIVARIEAALGRGLRSGI